MANFYAFYPPAGGGSNASVGINGSPAPTSSTEIGGINPEGNLTPVAVTDAGAVFVTPAAGSTTNVNLTEVGGAVISEGQKTMANSLPVVISSDQSPVHTIVDSSALPTGAATSANQTSEIGLLTGIEANQTNGTQETQIVGTVPLPTGAATSSNQVTQEATLTAIQANQTNGTQVTSVNNFPAIQPVSGTVTVVQPTGSNLHTTVDSSALPTGASTAALQSDVQSAPGTPQTVAITVQGNASGVPVPVSGTVTSTISGNVTVVQPTGTNLHTVIDSSALPTGAATSTNQTSEITQLTAINTNTTGLTVAQGSTTSGQTGQLIQGSVTTAAPTYTNGQTDPLSLTTTGALRVSSTPAAGAPGRSLANAPTVTTYATPVTSAAYVTIIASTTSATNLVELFDSSGVAIFFAIGAAAAEVNQFVIYPGGNGQVPLAIPAGSRISYKAVSTSATGATAYNVLNLYT